MSYETTLPPGGPWSRPYRRTTAGLLLTVAVGAFEALAVATIMPETVDDLGGLGYYGWAFSAFMLTKPTRQSHYPVRYVSNAERDKRAKWNR